jgi:hypothetical protein
MLCNVCYVGRAGGTEEDFLVRTTQYGQEQAIMHYAKGYGNIGRRSLNLMKNWLIKPIFRGIVVILYDGFRKCFVNCKFTFYITLS